MRLSTNFTLAELTNSSTADRLHIDNTLDPDDAKDGRIIDNLIVVCGAVLEPSRAHFGKPFVPNSGWRSYGLEEYLCQIPIEKFLRKHPDQELLDYLRLKSHPTGNAVDYEIPGIPNLELARWVERELDFDQLILEFYKEDDPTAGWVHVSYKDDGTNRHEIMTISRSGTVMELPK